MRRLILALLPVAVLSASAIAYEPPKPMLQGSGAPTVAGRPNQQYFDQATGTLYFWTQALGWKSLGTLGIGSTTQAASSSGGFQVQTSLLPNVLHQVDAAAPIVTTAVAGTPGIQLVSGGVNFVSDNVAAELVGHTGTPLTYSASGGPNNAAYFSDMAGVYDGLTFAHSDGDSFFAASGAPWTLVMVQRTTAAGGVQLVKVQSSSVNLTVDEQSNGGFSLGQNNGAASGSEPAEPLNTWQIVVIQTDGTRFQLWRNGGASTLTTPTGTIGGFGVGATTAMTLLNGGNADLTFAEWSNAAASQSVLSNEIARLGTKYGIATTAVTDGLSATVSPPPPLTAAQIFSNYIVNSGAQQPGGAGVYPSAADPIDNTAKPVGWNSADAANLTNKLSLVFGSANSSLASGNPASLITTRAQMDTHLEHNQIDGTAGLNYSNDQAKQANSGAFTAEFRTYAAGDVHDTVPVTANGVDLRAYCAANLGTSCQGQAGIVTGILRTETPVYPGDLVEVCYQSPFGAAAWGTNWLTGGQMPPAGTPNAQSLFYQPGGYPRSPQNYLETDDPDGYPPSDGVSSKNYLTGGVTELSNSSDEAIQGSPYSAPQVFYIANSGGYVGTANGQNTVVQTPFDRSLAVHCYTTELQKAVYSDAAKQTVPTTPGHIISYVDGVEYLDTLHNWNGGQNLVNYPSSVIDNNPASAIVVALQYGPKFDPNASAAMTPSVVNSDHMLVRSIRVWTRTGAAHVAPTLANGVTPPAPPVQPPAGTGPTLAFGATGFASTPNKASLNTGTQNVFMQASYCPTAGDLTKEHHLLGAWGTLAQSSLLLEISNGGVLAAEYDGTNFNYNIDNSVAPSAALVAGSCYTFGALYTEASGTWSFFLDAFGTTGSTALGTPLATVSRPSAPLTNDTTQATTAAWQIGETDQGASHAGGYFISGKVVAGGTASGGGTVVLNPVVNADGTIHDSTGSVWTLAGGAAEVTR